jgi:putative nucleotidyltransferase with HDIG domain
MIRSAAVSPGGVDASIADLLRNLYAHDKATHDHCRSVGAWSSVLAKALRLEPDEIKAALLAGTLHDIGKALVPAEILLEPGPLTAGQWVVMRRHAGDGAAMLAETPGLRSFAPIVRAHHENIDGRGYPDGLAGDDIPLLARIVAVSDAFHTMVTTRPYRQGMPVSDALDLLRRGAGVQWDAEIVDVMVDLVRAKTRRMGHAIERARAS